MRKYLMLIVLLLAMTGCGKGISVEAMKELSSGAQGISGTAGSQIVDATTAKHYWLYDMWREAMVAYGKAGMTVKLDDEGRVKSFSNTPAPDLSRLPRTIKDHAVWSTLNKFAQYGMFGFMASELAGVLKAGYDNASPETQYQGDLFGSENEVSGEYVLQRESMNPVGP